MKKLNTTLTFVIKLIKIGIFGRKIIHGMLKSINLLRKLHQ